MDRHPLLGLLIIGFAASVHFGCSDTTRSLGDGYVFVLEGGGVNSIFREGTRSEGVPQGIVECAHDDDFIIALQRPREFDDVIDQRVFDYKHGRDTTYFWVITKADQMLIGPLDRTEYAEVRSRLNIPGKLQLIELMTD